MTPSENGGEGRTRTHGPVDPLATIREALEVLSRLETQFARPLSPDALAALAELEQQLADRGGWTCDREDCQGRPAPRGAAEAALAEANEEGRIAAKRYGEEHEKRARAESELWDMREALAEANRRNTQLADMLRKMRTTIAQQLTPLDVAITHIEIIRRKGDEYSAAERDNVAAIVEQHAREARDALFSALDRHTQDEHMFARRNRIGWDTWGNEALEHVEMAS